MINVPPFYNFKNRDSLGQLGFFNNIDEGNLNGVQLGFANNVDYGDVEGVQLGCGNRVCGDLNGAQIGMMNFGDGFVKGIQLGFANVNEGIYGMQGALLFNFNEGSNIINEDVSKGVQLAGLYNKVDDSFKGLQISAFNLSTKYLEGLQLGVVCIACDGKYLQLGVLTYRSEADKWYKKFSPLIGFSRHSLEERILK